MSKLRLTQEQLDALYPEAMHRRTEAVIFKVTRHELAIIKKKAELEGRTVSALIRARLGLPKKPGI
jgi:hypothetical protein